MKLVTENQNKFQVDYGINEALKIFVKGEVNIYQYSPSLRRIVVLV
jgi:hypothetical protein